MEEVIEKLTNINRLIEILEKEDKDKFEGENSKQLNELEIIVNDLGKKLLEYNFSEERYYKNMLEKRKENIIVKNLFPYYWMMNQMVADLNYLDLCELEKYSNEYANKPQIFHTRNISMS